MLISVAHERLGDVFRGENVKFDVKFRNLESMTKKGYQQFCQMKRHNFWEKWMPIKKEISSEIFAEFIFLDSLKKISNKVGMLQCLRGDGRSCMYVYFHLISVLCCLR